MIYTLRNFANIMEKKAGETRDTPIGCIVQVTRGMFDWIEIDGVLSSFLFKVFTDVPPIRLP
jgi:hypothetical protein